jgi:dTMP kinase
VPTLSFYLEDDASVIADRLASRRLLSRLERAGSPGRELRLYAEAREFLNGHGWLQRACGLPWMWPPSHRKPYPPPSRCLSSTS